MFQGLKNRIRERLRRALRIDKIEERLDHLTAYSCDRENIDLVKIGSSLVFVYKSDHTYSDIPEEDRGMGNISSSRALAAAAAAPPRRDLKDFIDNWQSPATAFHRLLAHFLLYLPEFFLVDIGCSYGLTAMDYAQFIRSFGRNNKVMAFDPGRAGDLAPYNFANNGYGDLIDFYPYAVSDHDGYALMFRESGHPEHNRIVNRWNHAEQFSRPVRSVSLDSFISTMNCTGPLVIKIDTEGAEHEVFSGMRKILGDRLVAGMTEFTPEALSSRIEPAIFLENLMETHILFDMGASHKRLTRLTKG